MPSYRYKSIDKTGRTNLGVVTAESEAQLERRLSQQGLWLVEAELTRSPLTELRVKATGLAWSVRRKFGLWPKVARQDLIEVCVQLSTQLKAGVSILPALEATHEETENEYLRRVLGDIRTRIESGSTLHGAMEVHLGVFSRQMISVVRAGEISSHLPEALTEIRQELEWVERMVGDIRQATIYPLFVLMAIGLTGILLFSFVVPRFASLLQEVNVELPGFTRFVFGVSDFMAITWWVWLAILLLGPLFLRLIGNFSNAFGVYVDQVKISLPVFGPLNRMIAMSRFAHTLASLYRAGIQIVEALQYCERAAGNRSVEQAIKRVRVDVSEGNLLSQALAKEPIFTQLLRRMVATGEQTGQLEETLERVAEYYNEFVPRRVRRLFSYAEPLIVIGVVGIAGVVALAVFLPIVRLVQGIG